MTIAVVFALAFTSDQAWAQADASQRLEEAKALPHAARIAEAGVQNLSAAFDPALDSLTATFPGSMQRDTW